MKQKHWQVSVFDKTSETIRDDAFYTTDTEAYLVFELTDEDFTPDSATVTVYNVYGKATINASVEVADGIVRYEIPEEAIGHPGGWRTQVIYTKDNEDYTTGIINFDVGGHLLDNKKPAIVDIENWNSFMADARDWLNQFEGGSGGIEYVWNGTQLGVRKEGETEYVYVDLKGDKGDQGVQGERGLEGPQGIQGPKGDVGDKGDTGDTGPKGDKGDQGIQGPEGPQGLQGAEGPQGIQGERGPEGSQGVQGLKGDTGEQGIQGLQGLQGEQGLKGPKGDKGDKGDKGETGSVQELTKAHVETALGYVPADEADLSTDSVTLQGRTPSSFIEVVNHGAVSSYARPVGGISVLWIGTVEPQNATDNDIWIGG